MINYLAERYKTIVKRRYFSKAESIKNKYAFIGTGSHAITHLYPVLQHLSVPLSFIFSKHLSNTQRMCKIYKDCKAAPDMETILKDPQVTGVFVSTKPSSHYNLVKQLLNAGKNIFVEKPPCQTREELEVLLGAQQNLVLHVNFQQRFSPPIQYLKKTAANSCKFYRVEYLTGAYIKENVIKELFIHPLDLIFFSFGSVKNFSVKKIKTARGVTFFIHTEHNSGAVGELKLSTGYSWQNAQENIEVFTDEAYYTCNFPYYLKRTILPSRLLGMPSEKILQTPLKEEIIFNGHNISTSFSNHTAWLNGFYQSIESFVEKVENPQKKFHDETNYFINLYKMMEELEKL
jgi:virulence factor